MIKPRSVILYGASGSTKTSQMYHAVKYINKLTGKKFRIIHADSGGYAPFEDSGMIEKGIVEMYNYSASPFPLADLRRLSKGYWPKTVMINGGQVEGYLKSEDICLTKQEEWGQIAGYVIDGISGVGEVLKHNASDQDTGQGFKESWKIEEDGETITGLTQGHYGIAQKEIANRITRGFANLPMQWLLCTALGGKGEDKTSKETVYGPQIVGNACTSSSPSWFGDCLHLDSATYIDMPCKGNPKGTNQQVTGMVAWFSRHLDVSTQVPYLCKPRCAPEMYEKLLEYFPYGFVPLNYTFGIAKYFAVLDKLRKEFQNESKG